MIESPTGEAEPLRLPYSKVLAAAAYISASQRSRGVGTLVVTSKPTQQYPAGRVHLLKNTPEPERLAEWIRSKRS